MFERRAEEPSEDNKKKEGPLLNAEDALVPRLFLAQRSAVKKHGGQPSKQNRCRTSLWSGAQRSKSAPRTHRTFRPVRQILSAGVLGHGSTDAQSGRTTLQGHDIGELREEKGERTKGDKSFQYGQDKTAEVIEREG